MLICFTGSVSASPLCLKEDIKSSKILKYDETAEFDALADSFKVGSSVQLTCKPGLKGLINKRDHITAECKSDGSWSTTEACVG